MYRKQMVTAWKDRHFYLKPSIVEDKCIMSMTEIEILRDIVSLPGFFVIPKNKNQNPKRLERDFNLVRDRLKGMTYKELGEKYGITADRCSQLIRRMERIYFHHFVDIVEIPE